MVLDGKSSQEYPVNAGGPQGFIHSPTLFLLYINDLSDDVFCDIAIYVVDTTLYSNCENIDRSVFEEKSSFKFLGLTFSSKLD